MPHDFEDPDDHTPDIKDWIIRELRRTRRLGGGHVPSTAPEPSAPSWSPTRVRVLWALALTACAIIAMWGIKTLPLRDSESTIVDVDTLYASRAVPVHGGAGSEFPIVQTMSPGERVLAGGRERGRWLPLLTVDGDTIGYAYGSNENFGHTPPRGGRLPQPLVGARQPDPLSRSGKTRIDTTAICGDGTPSFSKHASGTCSSHRGVAEWINYPEP